MTPPLDLTRTPQTDPLEIYRYRDGLYAADLLTAAVCEFDFFTWLAAHPADKATICRDLGLQDATGGAVHAHIIRMVEPCGEKVRSDRHSHQLNCQFFYVLKGWMKLEFEGIGEVTAREGDCVYMPPGIKHTVLDYSPGLENLEIVMPAKFDTVPA